ncbi:reticulocyte-binding protein 2 homolog a [Colletes gigas]|uniref:reticulocyte-binding protein 2 homolog a n=1 Tax=Colletes gigas TaxID=935657 RepID=UPI001C9B6A4F|nr:reticulocyte-binding protein 2 homolog a [Colletes gigas]
MTSFYNGYNYHKKMLELQEKLRKSEERRIRLDERFKVLVQESRNRHDACINKLRYKYIESLGAQRTRDERNYKLLEALDRVDNSLASMTSKTNRLNVLRKQYEAYFREIYAVHNPPRRIIGNGSTTDPIECRHLKRNNIGEQIHLPNEVKRISSPQMFQKNVETNRCVFPSVSKFTKSMQNMYSNNSQQNIQLRASNERRSDSRSSLRTNLSVQRSSFPDLSSQNDREDQEYCNDNMNLVSHNFQVHSSPRIPNASSYSEMNLLNQRTIEDFNKSSPQRMGTIQTRPRLVIPERSNDCVFQYKGTSVVENRTTSSTSQNCINPSSMMEYFPQKNNKILLNNSYTPTKNDDEMIGFETTPMIMSNTQLNFPKRSPSSYLDHSLRISEYCENPVPEARTRSLRDTHDNYMMKRHENFARKVLPEENNGVTNELDRYIDRVRKLYRDLEVESLIGDNEDRNKSEDTFNATLLDDEVEFLPENKPKENVTFRPVNSNGAKNGENKNRVFDLIKSTQINAPKEISKEMTQVKDDTNELKCEKQNTDDTLNEYEQLSKVQQDDEHVAIIVSSNDNDMKENGNDTTFEDKREDKLYERDAIDFAEQSKLQQYSFDVVDELEPWNFDDIQKQVKLTDLIDEIKQQSVEKQPTVDEFELNHANIEEIKLSNEANAVESEADEQNVEENKDVEILDSNDMEDQSQQQHDVCFDIEKSLPNENEVVTSQYEELESKGENCITNDNMLQSAEFLPNKFDEEKKHDNEQEEEYGESSQASCVNENDDQEIITSSKESNDYIKEYNEEENDTHNAETPSADLNKEFNYDQNVTHVQESNIELANNPENQYEHDTDVQYQENLNQQYSSTCKQQRDPNQVDLSQEQQDNTEREQNENSKEQQEESKDQEVEKVLEKQDENESSSEKLSTEHEFKKKKDVIKSLLDSDTDSIIERNASNTESDFDFN